VNKPCIICGNISEALGCFVPNEDSLHNTQNIALKNNKRRHIYYPICLDCIPRGDHDAPRINLIEEKIWRIYLDD